MSRASGAIEQRLREAELEIVGTFVDASNATLLARFTDRDPRSPEELAVELGRAAGIDDFDPADLAVVKPQRGEAPLWDFATGSLHRREVAAYVISAALGWKLVPETVLHELPELGPASVQRFVPHDPRWHYFSLLESGGTAVMAELRAMVAFDLVVQNADRKAGHVLVESLDTASDASTASPRSAMPAPVSAGSVRLIDHGVAFSVEPKLRTVAWEFAGERIPSELLADLDALREALAGELGARLVRLLDTAEVEVLAKRITAVLADPRFPYPHGPRPYPWPLL